MDMIFDALLGSFDSILPKASIGLVKLIDDILKYNNGLIDMLFENSAVLTFFAFTLSIGGLMYAGGVGFAFANFTIENKEDSGAQITDTIKNIFIGLAAVCSYTTIPVLFLRFTNYICDLMVSELTKYSLLDWLKPELMGNGAGQSGESTGMSVTTGFCAVYGIIMFVCVCKIFFSNIKRGGILVTLIFVCSFHMFSIPRGYTDAFWSWCKQVAGVCITAFVQNFLIALSFLILTAVNKASLDTLVVSAGVALSASEVPRILQQFGLDTSMKANISQAIFATSGVVSIARAFV